jgi:uncharacterized cupredoxin-like copper-binding protein
MSRNRARLAIGAGLLGLLLVAGAAAAVMARPRENLPTSIVIDIHYSKFVPAEFSVPVGVPITITINNNDPIDHEWIVGDDAVHQVHRTGTELLHPDKPTEVVIPAGESRTTVITFVQAGSLKYICHLPAHEAYGMVGTVHIQ